MRSFIPDSRFSAAFIKFGSGLTAPPTLSLQDKLEAFRPHVPLIAALRNPGLRDRHWKKISQIAGVANQIKGNEEGTTFKKFLELKLQDHLPDIQEISEYASKEYRLEKQLEKMTQGVCQTAVTCFATER